MNIFAFVLGCTVLIITMMCVFGFCFNRKLDKILEKMSDKK
jgi:galactitol-specific phosphotransferase system IIC component